MMALRFLRFATLLLAALSLTMESAHVLELPQKLKYSPELYAEVNGTLYRYFAIVGGTYQIASIAAALALVWAVRGHGATFRWTAAGAALLVAAFATWLAVVAPVNQQIAQAFHSSRDGIPALWVQLRDRWEYGHAAGFAIQLLGLSALLWSVLVETAGGSRGPLGAREHDH